TRRREIAIRAALGAPSGRIIQQILAESVLLSLLGGAAGLVLSGIGIHALTLLKPPRLPRLEMSTVDTTVLTFTFLVSLVVGVLFGLAPALSASLFNLSAKLKEDKRATSAAGSGIRFRKLLVVSEIALALIVLVGAGLLLRSFSLLHEVDPGLR